MQSLCIIFSCHRNDAGNECTDAPWSLSCPINILQTGGGSGARTLVLCSVVLTICQHVLERHHGARHEMFWLRGGSSLMDSLVLHFVSACFLVLSFILHFLVTFFPWLALSGCFTTDTDFQLGNAGGRIPTVGKTI